MPWDNPWFLAMMSAITTIVVLIIVLAICGKTEREEAREAERKRRKSEEEKYIRSQVFSQICEVLSLAAAVNANLKKESGGLAAGVGPLQIRALKGTSSDAALVYQPNYRRVFSVSGQKICGSPVLTVSLDLSRKDREIKVTRARTESFYPLDQREKALRELRFFVTGFGISPAAETEPDAATVTEDTAAD